MFHVSLGQREEQIKTIQRQEKKLVGDLKVPGNVVSNLITNNNKTII